jgi:hypothetical protein
MEDKLCSSTRMIIVGVETFSYADIRIVQCVCVTTHDPDRIAQN